jgi:hypothetical protein
LLRIWDAYFLCGYDIFFFVAIALLSTYESKWLIYYYLYECLILNYYIEKLLASDLDVCMEILGSTMSVPDDNKFMRTIEKLYAKNARMNTIANLRKEYQSKH